MDMTFSKRIQKTRRWQDLGVQAALSSVMMASTYMATYLGRRTSPCTSTQAGMTTQ
uniref:Uncharacterized protein n=1 Tax=Arundo donax TaxID=35708 RepID=A0A0A9DX02_ARUDO